MQFTYQNPTLIEFGQQSISKINTLIEKSERVLVLYGGGSIKKNGVYDQVKEALDGYAWFEFGGVEPNPTKEKLDEAIAYGRSNEVSFILAVGGGSVIDGAKYVANAFYYEGDGWDLLEGKYNATKALKIGAVLTLAATGSESNTGSVITKKETKEKRFFHSAFSYPQFAIMDPDVLKSLDDRQLSNGLIDSFVHTCEQYLTQPHGALAQDYYAEGILRGLIELAHSYDKKDDLWYANLMWLANQALNGLIGVGVPQDWATHFIGHELSGLYGIDHARTLAIIQPNLLTILANEKQEKLMQMGKNVFGMQALTPFEVIEEIRNLYASLNVDLKLSSYTDDKEVISKVTNLLEKHGFTHFGDRGSIDKSVVEKILEKSI
ncbi:iron-containing alcohol dehydrogenase [Candidatus Marinarcus aquaticus]|uniref:NADH-dependent alcohol dehydrogenase n=1 Tax=Candidatus Marinarcus aquaticus TaxID=2044504 RepID=A0A4Q0XS13_9BACT|nr:iron-containing alcohol dehydrogenase [Candidatus Marinarcus aquaticus]RXJ60307.1 NADH-dependent alcohol dehydrogenase [Candidatus Marinarcus aquaticus]